MRHVARKRFGQHFLQDKSVVAAIVGAIAPAPEDVMVEIGPGLGALTRPLAEKAGHLHVVEIDRDLVRRLVREFDPRQVTVHEADVLGFDFSKLGAELRVVGNLPYNISTPVLFQLVRMAAGLHDVHVMLQREVVERMAAAPGGPEYGRLSVMLQYHFAIETVLKVPPNAFEPIPKVESAVARLVPLALRSRAQDEELFAAVVARAFAQRRKTLRNSLAPLVAADDYEAIGIDPGARAQELAVEDFVRLANHLAQRRNAAEGPTEVGRVAPRHKG